MEEKTSIAAKFAGTVVKHNRLIMIVFVVLLLFSLVSSGWTTIEEDYSKFLSQDTHTRQCLDIDAVEFTSYGDVYLMVKHVTREEALELQKKIDSFEDVFYHTDTIEDSEDGNGVTATFYVSLMTRKDDEKCLDTVEKLEHLLDDYDESYYYSELQEALNDTITQQMSIIICAVVAAVIVILVVTSHSFAEVPVLLLVFIFSAVLNMGTNFIFGTVSLISNAVSVTLQLALSMDYAIIYCNRYLEQREKLECRQAVEIALVGACPEILASSLTTMAGLLAMTFMEFGLGADMGRVLIKAIVISMATVFTLMPALLVVFDKAIQKTKHRILLPKVSFIGKYAYLTRHVAPIILVIVVVAACWLFGKCDITTNVMSAPAKNLSDISKSYLEIQDNMNLNQVELEVPAGDYKREKALIQKLENYPELVKVTGVANTEALDGYLLGDSVDYTDVQKISGVEELTAKAVMALYATEKCQYKEFMEDPENYQVPLIDLFDCLYSNIDNPSLEISDEQIASIQELHVQLARLSSELQGERYSRLILLLDLPMDGDETYAFIDTVLDTAAEYYPENVHIAGTCVIYKEMYDAYTSDKVTTSVWSIGLVMLILLFTFKSVIMPVMLILVIQGSIWINFAIAGLTGTPVYFLVYLIVSSIQMGSNIDYAIVSSSRYLELRRHSDDKRQCLIETMNFVFPTIMTSGGIMILSGLLIYNLVSEGVVAGFGQFMAIGTLITVILVLFFLPQMLTYDKLVLATSLSIGKGKFPALQPRRKQALVMAVLCLVCLVAGPLGTANSYKEAREQMEEYESDLEGLDDLIKLAKRCDTEMNDTEKKVEFVEEMLTELYGDEELEQGQAELEKGAKELEDAQKTYDEGMKEYEAYYNQYLDGKNQLESGQEEYDQYLALYEAGLEEYNAGKAAYDEGLRQYNEGKAAYEAGLAAYEAGQAEYETGKAELEAAQQEYNTSKETLDSLSAVYSTVDGIYQEYLNAQAQYDAAVKNGNILDVIYFGRTMESLNAAFESQIGGTGYSISSLLAAYEDAQKQLADAEVQLAEAEEQLKAGEQELAEGETQLAEAKQQLADGEAELAVAKQQLEEGEKELAEGKAQLDAANIEIQSGKSELVSAEIQLDDGKKQLDDGKQQLDAGYKEYEAGQAELEAAREYLADNSYKVAEGIDKLDILTQERSALEKAMENLNSIDEARLASEKGSSDTEFLRNAKTICENQVRTLKLKLIYYQLTLILLVLGCALGLMAALFIILEKDSVSRILIIAGGAAAFGSAVSAFGFTDIALLKVATLALTAGLGIFIGKAYRAKP